MLRITGPYECGYCEGAKRVDDNDCPRCDGRGVVFLDDDGDAIRVDLRAGNPPLDTITLDGHEYVRLVLTPRDESGGAIDASEV